MTDTTRRVAISLVAITDEDAHHVMAGVLDAVRNALPGLRIDHASNNVFDLGDPDEPAVQIVVDPAGGVRGISGAWVDDPDRAEEFARNTGGVVVTLPVETDHRGEAVDRNV